MEHIGIIDLGSNSVRLIIIKIDTNGSYYQKENLKETVRLVKDIDQTGSLSEKSMEYAIKTIRLFVNFCKAHYVDHIIAVATAATRRANNRQIFIERIKQETGLTFKVLSGEEEAHYGYLGAVNTMPQTSGLMADLGGGSFKLVSFRDRMKENSSHFPFGSVTLTNKFNTEDKPDPTSLKELESFLIESYKSLLWLKGSHPIIGVGGTFRSLARVVRKDKEQRLNIPGLERARADIIVAGVAAIKCLMETTGREKIITSTSSIRNGLLYEYLNRYTKDPIVLSVLTHHIDNLINYYHLEENHLRRVSNLAVTLFDQLYQIHGFNGFERRLLLIASLLHEIGTVIGMEGVDKHTLYVLLNAPLHGLTHRERVIAAYLAASHTELYLVNIDQYITHGPLLIEDKELIKKLAIILQITHSLDRSQTGIVTQVRAAIADGQCNLRVIAKADADLEINDAKRNMKTFDDVFGYKLNIYRS